jgi:hypothetical protein
MKKFTALFLIFSLVMLSANLYAKEKRGAKLIVTKTDSQQIRGELITVKPNSLLLLDAEGKDVSVDIVDIKVIRIVKKSKAWTGALRGFLLGGSFGVVLFGLEPPIDDWSGSRWAIFCVILIGLPSALIGALIGAAKGPDKTIQIEGMTDFHEFREALEYLRKKARIRDYE